MEILKITRDLASYASHIYALSWKSAYQNIVPQKYLDDLSLEQWTPFLLDSSCAGFIVMDNGEFVATSSVSKARDERMEGFGEVISIYVLPQHLGKGYGKKLLSYVINQLHCSGFNDIYLWALEDNCRARNFYERNGFVSNGERKTINIGGKELVEVQYVHSGK